MPHTHTKKNLLQFTVSFPPVQLVVHDSKHRSCHGASHTTKSRLKKNLLICANFSNSTKNVESRNQCSTVDLDAQSRAYFAPFFSLVSVCVSVFVLPVSLGQLSLCLVLVFPSLGGNFHQDAADENHSRERCTECAVWVVRRFGLLKGVKKRGWDWLEEVDEDERFVSPMKKGEVRVVKS
ncbi:hypothetical protein DM02DRAFT_314991 [Periconia macrospinosa]|uniref:Transmembrane protein n=1 Tax=Periconia macrospinosa TaxID=97972 RepID=A0A2V1D2H3_9PLEO|nr:hypothetical protein DM02DRAFT_314991 [Periconia macrospinosa]